MPALSRREGGDGKVRARRRNAPASRSARRTPSCCGDARARAVASRRAGRPLGIGRHDALRLLRGDGGGRGRRVRARGPSAPHPAAQGRRSHSSRPQEHPTPPSRRRRPTAALAEPSLKPRPALPQPTGPVRGRRPGRPRRCPAVRASWGPRPAARARMVAARPACAQAPFRLPSEAPRRSLRPSGDGGGAPGSPGPRPAVGGLRRRAAGARDSRNRRPRGLRAVSASRTGSCAAPCACRTSCARPPGCPASGTRPS